MKVLLVLTAVLATCLARPQTALPAGVSASICPNYPFCVADLSSVPGFAAHQAAEAAIRAQQAQDQGQVTNEAAVRLEQDRLIALQQQQQAANTFTGLVGPSGVIGPSGLVGPAGPVAFGRK